MTNPDEQRRDDLERKKAEAIAESGFSVDAILSSCSKHHQALNAARRKCWAAAYDEGYSFEAIGEAFNRHHTSIMSGVRRYQADNAELPEIKPLSWDRRSDGLSVATFLGTTYTLTSLTGPYTLTCAGSVLYSGSDREEAMQAAHDHAQAQVAEVLA